MTQKLETKYGLAGKGGFLQTLRDLKSKTGIAVEFKHTGIARRRLCISMKKAYVMPAVCRDQGQNRLGKRVEELLKLLDKYRKNEGRYTASSRRAARTAPLPRMC